MGTSIKHDGTLCKSELQRSALLTPRHRQFFDTEGRSRYMPSPKSARTRTLSKLLAWATPAMLAASLNANADCNLTVQFTTQGNPALHEVTSIISQNDNFMAAENRHSYTIQLPCPAQYNLVALLDNKKATRSINLRTDSKLIVNMGN